MKEKNIYNISEKIAFIFLCIVMADCCIFGAGRLVSFGPIGFRMAALAGMLVFAIPAMLKRFKEIMRNKFMVAILCFALWLVVALVIGIINENRTSLIASDIKGFMYFVALPAMLVLVNNKERMHKVMKVMMYASTVLAAFSFFMQCVYLWINPLYFIICKPLKKYLVSSLSVISPTMPRLFFNSVPYLLCGCAFAVYFQLQEKEKKLKLRYILITALCLFAMFMTFTRSIYLGAFLAAAGTVVSLFAASKKLERKRLFLQVGSAVGTFLAVVLFFSAITNSNYLGFAILRSAVTGDTNNTEDGPIVDDIYENTYLEKTQQSDQVRALTLKGLYRNIKKSPIVGIGLGAEFEERERGLNEYFYLDLWSKAGIIGVVLYMTPVGLLIYTIYKKRNDFNIQRLGTIISFSVLIGIMAASWFNPYMNASLGILFYCFTLASANCWEKEE